MAKTMRQPRKDVLREQLALAAEEIIRLKTEAASKAVPRVFIPLPATPWWRRLLAWGRGNG